MKILNFSQRAIIYLLLVALSCMLTTSEAYAGVKSHIHSTSVLEMRWPSFGLLTKKTKGQKITNCPAQGKSPIRNSRKHSRSCYKFR